MADSKALGLAEVLDEIKEEAEGKDEVNLGDIVEMFSSRGFGPLLLAPALIALLPTGGIPGVPTACAVVIVLLAGQLLVGRRHPWLPSKLRQLSMSSGKVKSAMEKTRGIAKGVDKLTTLDRMKYLVTPTSERIVAGVCILLALFMVPLELLPFAVMLPASSIVVLALSLSAKDGLWTLFGLIATLAIMVGGFYYFGTLF